jgi:hypothetical protein
MSVEDKKPYVVSADLSLLLKRWSCSSGYSVPNEDFIQGLTRDLESALSDSLPHCVVEIVDEDEIKTGLGILAEESKYPIASLDRVYVDDNAPNVIGYLDFTRAVNENFESLGLQPREGFLPVDSQLAAIAKIANGPIILLDDVVFSGADMTKEDKTGICQKLEKMGSPVVKVITGIGIGEGVTKLRNAGIEVECVREYDQVEDEICKRDFFACIPMSGRMLIDKNGVVWSAPYFKPFGDPKKWASIPESAATEFSRFALKQSILLWQKVESLSQSTISTDIVPRRIRELERGISVVQALKKYLS